MSDFHELVEAFKLMEKLDDNPNDQFAKEALDKLREKTLKKSEKK